MKAAGQHSRRLRVLLAMEASGGGVARHVLDLAEGLLRRDHEVVLIYSSERAEDWCSEAIRAMPELRARQLPMRRAVGVDDLALVIQLRRIIDRYGPFDILHGHSSKAGALLRLAAIGKSIPCIYTPHAFMTLNPGLGKFSRVIYGTSEWLLSHIASKIICVSEQEMEHARTLGIHFDRLSLVHNGIPLLPRGDRAAMRKEMQIDEDEVCVGFVGRLSAQKSVHRLITAFAETARDRDRMRLVIVGDGPDRSALEGRVQDLGISDQVVFAGSRNGVAVMAGFDIFVLPSQYEAFPYVLLEAASQGLPIVMTQTGGAHAVVRQARNGFIVAQGDNEELAKRLSQLVDDRDLARRMGEYSVSVAAEFSIDNMVTRTVQIYMGALASTEESVHAFQ